MSASERRRSSSWQYPKMSHSLSLTSSRRPSVSSRLIPTAACWKRSAEPLFAFPQRLFRPMAFGDVAKYQNCAEHAAIGLTNRRHRYRQ